MTLFLLIGVVFGWIYGFSLIWELLRHAFSKRKLKPKPNPTVAEIAEPEPAKDENITTEVNEQ